VDAGGAVDAAAAVDDRRRGVGPGARRAEGVERHQGQLVRALRARYVVAPAAQAYGT